MRLSGLYRESESMAESTVSFAVSKMTAPAVLTQMQFDACVLFCLRTSISTFFNSYLLQSIKEKNFKKSAELFLKYAYDSKGLNKEMLRDRKEESKLFEKGTK